MTLMATLRATGITIAFLVVTLLLIPVQWLGVKLHAGWRRTLPHVYHRFVCRLMGARITVLGTPLKGGVLLTANHTGWIDIPILSAVAPVSFVAKQEVNLWPFFGTLARLQRTVFIRRERSKALEDRDTIRRRLRDGDALVIFPEGTSGDGNRVLPFKSSLLSAAELAMGEGADGVTRHAPVQPVSVSYVGLHGLPMGRENRPLFAWYGDMDLVSHLWEALGAGPIDVIVELHEPLTIDQAGGRKELAAAAEAAVRGGLVRALSGANSAAAVPHRDDDLLEALEQDDAEIDNAA
jgi:1-acyl-sn-glycerol-3-phosphate acyltransferase